MEELLASQPKVLRISRGQEVEGEIVAQTDKEITLDLGAKSEGILPKKEVSDPDALKLGVKLKAFIVSLDNGSGQIVLSKSAYSGRVNRGSSKGKKNSLDKFVSAQKQGSELSGQVLEINRGGLIIEALGSRGFLPNSQIGYDLLKKTLVGVADLVGLETKVSVIEIDEGNNRLIFGQKLRYPEVVVQLKNYKIGDKVKGKISAVLNFGLIINISNTPGLVFISDVAWEKVEDLGKLFQVGEEIEAQIISVDSELGKLNLSIKQLSEDPFTKLADQYHPDDAIKAEVVSANEFGVTFRLNAPAGESGISGLEGFLPTSKMKPDTKYEVGQIITMLVDSIDKNHRKINLAPMVTSTEGLIYK
jgi:small subunit ribosomal protein S1